MKRIVVMCLLLCLAISQTMAGGKTDTKPVRRTNPGPAITGPITGGEHGRPFGSYFGDMKHLGYVEEEYFLEGIALRYSHDEVLTRDGMWDVKPGNPTPYKTRILVRKPIDPAKFNGTVVLEWANVSNGYEISFADPPGLYQNGFAYISVSAQTNGIYGYPDNPQGLIAWDTARYSSLNIPDEGVCYDIFTQAAKSAGPNRAGYINGKDPMAGLAVKKLIGIGGSQSGTRVTAYVNGVQPIEGVFDALMPMLNAGTSADFEDTIAHPNRTEHSRSIPAKIRTDLKTKIFVINTETEALFYFVNRQPDTDSFRAWEVAGSAHAPTRTMQLIRQKTDRDGLTDSLGGYPAVRASDVNWLYTVDAAIYHTQKWITDGTPPPSAPPMEIDMANRDYSRDANGNSLGGIRLPELTVPVSRYVAGPAFQLGGYTIPFNEAKLRQLYPTHNDYVNKVTAAARAVGEAGYILPYRVEEYIKMAQAAPVPVYAEPDLTPRISRQQATMDRLQDAEVNLAAQTR
jgi:hypothetical protein